MWKTGCKYQKRDLYLKYTTKNIQYTIKIKTTKNITQKIKQLTNENNIIFYIR